MDIEKISKIVGVFGVVVPLGWGAFTYTSNLDKERTSFSFKNYHDIIAEIYDGGRRGYSGSQRALIYELTNFPEYSEFTCREFLRMKSTFENSETLSEIETVSGKIGCSS